jgi:hypothetical protein
VRNYLRVLSFFLRCLITPGTHLGNTTKARLLKFYEIRKSESQGNP